MHKSPPYLNCVVTVSEKINAKSDKSQQKQGEQMVGNASLNNCCKTLYLRDSVMKVTITSDVHNFGR